MIRKSGLFVFLFAASIFLSQNNANATAILTLSDGTNTTTISDPGGSGILLLNGPVGVGAWIVNVTTGLTKPILGSGAIPSMHLNSVDVSSVGGGILTIKFSDYGWTNSDYAFYSSIGGLISGSIAARSYIGSVDIFNETFVGAFSTPFSGSGLTNTDATISITSPLVLEAIVTHKGSSVSSFDFAVSVPESSTLLLFSTGLVGLIGYRRKRRMA